MDAIDKFDRLAQIARQANAPQSDIGNNVMTAIAQRRETMLIEEEDDKGQLIPLGLITAVSLAAASVLIVISLTIGYDAPQTQDLSAWADPVTQCFDNL